MTPLLVCDRGQKTKPKIILTKFCPGLALRYKIYLSANSRSWLVTYANLWNLILPKLRLGQNFANMIFGLVFCPLSHTKKGVIGGGTRCRSTYRPSDRQADTFVNTCFSSAEGLKTWAFDKNGRGGVQIKYFSSWICKNNLKENRYKFIPI